MGLGAMMSRYDNVVPLTKAESFDAPEFAGARHARQLVFADPASRAVLSLLDRVAPSDAPIQITGETGTGKELVARYVHRQSKRSGPFLAVNCGAISEHLIESEFFGHEAGSFTGAGARREGWFEAAHGGTLFLDEIGDMPMALQGKLLRVLQEGEVTRIGSRKPTVVDVRVVSATNVNLEAAVEAGRFRRDLFYRLKIVSVALPALRERPDDIFALSEHFVEFYSRKLGRRKPSFSPDAYAKLIGYDWPGNVRELENAVHVALLMSTGDSIAPEDILIRVETDPIPEAGLRGSSVRSAGLAAPTAIVTSRGRSQVMERIGEAMRDSFRTPGNNLLRDVERMLIADAFKYCGSNQVRTAELLGISRNVVRTLLKRHGLIADGMEVDEGVDEVAGVVALRERTMTVAPCYSGPF
jgi:DNA-binding NtrC family response regulator